MTRSAIVALLMLAACDPARRDPETIAADVILTPLETCEALEAHLEDLAVDAYDAEIEARLDRGFITPPIAVQAAVAPRLVGDGPWDRIVADEGRVFILDRGRIRVLGIDPLEELASAAVDGAPIAVLPAGHRVFVVTKLEPSYRDGPPRPHPSVETRTRIGLMASSDLSLVGSIDLAGDLRSASVHDGRLTVVITGGLVLPPHAAEELTVLARDGFREDREQAIRERTLDDWLEPDDLGRDCATFYASSAPLELGLTRIIDLDSRDLAASVRTIVGDIAAGAQSSGTLLLAAPHRWRIPRAGQVEYSYLFAFELTTGAMIAGGGMEGSPLALAIGSDRIDALTRIERRVPDPINAWGRVTLEHRVQSLAIVANQIFVSSMSPAFAEQELLRAHRLTRDRALAATADRLYAFELDHLDSPAAFAIDRPIDRFAEARGSTVGLTDLGDQLVISTLDSASLGRVLSTRSVAKGSTTTDLAFATSPANGLIAVPEIEASVAVRILAVDDLGRLTSTGSIDLSAVHGDSPQPPHLLYGLFTAGRAIAVSDLGAAAIDEANLAAVQSISFK